MKCPYCRYTGISQLEIDLYECQMCGERFSKAESEVKEEVIIISKPSLLKRIISWVKKIFRRIFKRRK